MRFLLRVSTCLGTRVPYSFYLVEVHSFIEHHIMKEVIEVIMLIGIILQHGRFSFPTVLSEMVKTEPVEEGLSHRVENYGSMGGGLKGHK